MSTLPTTYDNVTTCDSVLALHGTVMSDVCCRELMGVGTDGQFTPLRWNTATIQYYTQHSHRGHDSEKVTVAMHPRTCMYVLGSTSIGIFFAAVFVMVMTVLWHSHDTVTTMAKMAAMPPINTSTYFHVTSTLPRALPWSWLWHDNVSKCGRSLSDWQWEKPHWAVNTCSKKKVFNWRFTVLRPVKPEFNGSDCSRF